MYIYIYRKPKRQIDPKGISLIYIYTDNIQTLQLFLGGESKLAASGGTCTLRTREILGSHIDPAKMSKILKICRVGAGS